MRIPDMLAAGVRRFPDKPAVIEGDRARTFAELDARAAALAAALRGAGVAEGDRVALLALNELEFTEVQVAVARTGAIFVPLNFRLALAELRYIVGNCTPSLLIAGPGFEETAEQLGLPVWRLGDEHPPDPDHAGPVLLESEAPAQILYTSGTTGQPKGAVISHGGIFARYAALAFDVGVMPDDVFLQALPMFHIAGTVGFAYTYAGATHVNLPQFDPQTCLELMAGHRISHTVVVPTIINVLAHHPATAGTDLSALEIVLYGGSPIAPEVLRAAHRAMGCGFVQFYGMTETFAATILRAEDQDPERSPHLLATAGIDTVGYQVRVVDHDDAEVARGERGEVVVRGPGVMQGYWNDESASAEALRGGWMHTGDVGVISGDGYLQIVDRLKDMIVSGGENVYPREVEDVLYEHPELYDATVIGIPSEQWGEAVHAIVVPAPDTEPDEASVLAFCRERLAGYKVPKSVEFAEDLPRNAIGKVLKRELRARHWEGRERAIA